jgi:regulatory protein YycI of two-component signal transduction system YycFG
VKEYLTKSNFILLLLVIIVILAVLLMSKGGSDDSSNAVELYKLEQSIADKNKSIQALEERASLLSDSVVVLKQQRDSLHTLKQKVKYRYREIYINLPHYSNSQLDSVIRTNW